MTNTNRDTAANRENIFQMYKQLTPESKKKFDEYLNLLLCREHEKEVRG